MCRVPTAGLAFLALLSVAGCVDDGADRRTIRNKPITTPTVSAESVEIAERVDQIGGELLAANALLGIDPTFHTVALAEPLLFHPDLNGLMVSEGLVKRCKSDAQLAAVLASELGRMAAERKTANRFRMADPMPGLPDSNNGLAGGIAPDQNRLVELARYEKETGRAPSGAVVASADDPVVVAIDVLRTAGYSDRDLDAVAPLLADAAKNRKLALGVGGRPAAPKWSP